MSATKKHNYDESKIKTLSSLEHIRKRTGMYIGRVGDGSHYDDGIYVLVKEVMDNAIDEFIIDNQDSFSSPCFTHFQTACKVFFKTLRTESHHKFPTPS